MEHIYLNGINGDSGDYLFPSVSPLLLSKIALGEQIDDAHLRELKWWYHRINQVTLGPKEGIDPKNIAQTGWGIIFAHADANAQVIREALGELLNLRREQAGEYYKEYFGVYAYRTGESKQNFLTRHGTGPGPADPVKVPYYLLIVGDPELIPYRFQYQLDVQYAVGRLHFEKPEDYAYYANSVVAAEKGEVKLPQRAVFFGVQNQDDRATNLSAEKLIKPLAEFVAQDKNNWTVQTKVKEETTKKHLGEYLGGGKTPALLFTASHGMGFNNGSIRQLPHQGALLCQDWLGPNEWKKPIIPEHYFSADDISADSNLQGLIAFHFACYGVGTPKLDDFAYHALGAPKSVAPHAFVARLPQRLLSHPKGGALAVIGHVERAWGYSFTWSRAGQQLQTFESTLKRLMEGHPVGSALEPLNARYAELSSDLSTELEDIRYGKTADEEMLAAMWTANNDARNYAIIGDPAVRLSI